MSRSLIRCFVNLNISPTLFSITAVLQFPWSLWIEQCGVYFHPCDEDPSQGTPEGKTPLDRIGSALHQLENRYSLK